MKILAWIVFLPLACILIVLAQLWFAFIASFSFWAAVPIGFGSGILGVLAGGIPVVITPNKKIAAIIIVTFFVVLEAIAALTITLASMTEAILRLYCDVTIVMGAVAFAKMEK